jgi:hypothetical protein
VALIDVERAILAICFRAEPPEPLLAELGDRDRWLIYREMVRDRLWREIRVALPRTCELLGETLLAREFNAFLELDPPRTRYFRGVVSAFVASALPRWRADASMAFAPAAIDLVGYELARWEVADLVAGGAAPQEFSFDRIPVLSPALRLLHVEHAVQRGHGTEVGEHFLCVHRRDDRASVRTWILTARTFELLARFVAADASVSAIVRDLAAARGGIVDAGYVDALCATLAQFIEVGIVLGSA